MKKFTEHLPGVFGAIIIIGLAYFLYEIIIAGNVLQSIASAIIGGVMGIILMALMFGARNSEDKMYEVAVMDLQKQLTDEQHHFNLMKSANQSLENDRTQLEVDNQRQAEIIKQLCEKLKIEEDSIKAREIRCYHISKKSISEDGKIVE